MAETVLSRNWPAAVRSLRHRDFRALWFGLIISAVGTWMQIVAQSLLVLRLSRGSAFALGVVSLAQALAFFLFALIGGGSSDRLDRRRLLLVTQSLMMVLALTMGLLTITGVIQVWMIVLIAFGSGAVLSFDQPARAALISTLVPREDLLNAISLQSTVFNGAATLGPAFAGIAIDAIGLPANFFLNALSFAPVLVTLAVIRSPQGQTAVRGKLVAQIREALGTVKRDPVLPYMLTSYGVLLFAAPSLPLLLPVLAVRNLHISASTLGFLFSAAGCGAVLGALFLAITSDIGGKSPVLFGAFTAWVTSLIFVGFSRTVVASFVALVVFGMSQSIIGTITSTLLQIRVPPEQRGRVMSLNTLLIMGVRPLGDFPAGGLINLVGAPITAAVSAIVVGVMAFSLFAKHAALRTL